MILWINSHTWIILLDFIEPWFGYRYKKLLIFNTALQTGASFQRVVNIPNCKGSSRRDSYSAHFLIVVMFIVQSSVVDKVVDKTLIFFTISSTRPVLEALVDKPVDKSRIFSTVSSTRGCLEALVDKPVDKT